MPLSASVMARVLVNVLRAQVVSVGMEQLPTSGTSEDVTAHPMPLATYVAFCRALEPTMPVAACDEYRLYGDSPADAAELWAASQRYETERSDKQVTT